MYDFVINSMVNLFYVEIVVNILKRIGLFQKDNSFVLHM